MWSVPGSVTLSLWQPITICKSPTITSHKPANPQPMRCKIRCSNPPNQVETNRKTQTGNARNSLCFKRIRLIASHCKRWEWAREDSNLRRNNPADLQSAPFGHFGTRPSVITSTYVYPVLNKLLTKVSRKCPEKYPSRDKNPTTESAIAPPQSNQSSRSPEQGPKVLGRGRYIRPRGPSDESTQSQDTSGHPARL